MFELIDKILALLQAQEDFVLTTIIGDKGSTPRTAGSKMVVQKDGAVLGTIGGGNVEGDVIAAAMELFKTRGAEIRDYDLGLPANAGGMDLICGGRMQVLLECVQANAVNNDIFGQMYEEMKKTNPFFWLGKIRAGGGKTSVTRAMVTAKGICGGVQLPAALENNLADLSRKSETTLYLKEADDHYVVELIQPPDTVILVGGGHVSLELAHLAKISGFNVIVIDDRVEFANKDRFPEVDRVVVCPQYKDVFNDIQVNTSSYIVIVTRGHLFDKQALAQALKTDGSYIGMIGSRRKRETVYKDLMNQGVSRDDLDKVHCPVGLEIHAETPVEIGISVVAQLIKHRASSLKQKRKYK